MEAVAGAPPTTPSKEDLSGIGRGLQLAMAIATWELLGAGERAGLDRDRLLAIVNASSGRNEWTRGGYPGPVGISIAGAAAVIGEAVATGRRQRVPVSLMALAASIAALGTAMRPAGADLSALRDVYRAWSREG